MILLVTRDENNDTFSGVVIESSNNTYKVGYENDYWGTFAFILKHRKQVNIEDCM